MNILYSIQFQSNDFCQGHMDSLFHVVCEYYFIVGVVSIT